MTAPAWVEEFASFEPVERDGSVWYGPRINGPDNPAIQSMLQLEPNGRYTYHDAYNVEGKVRTRAVDTDGNAYVDGELYGRWTCENADCDAS